SRWPARLDRGVLLCLFADDPQAQPPFPSGAAAERMEIEASPWTLYLVPFRSCDYDNVAYFARSLAPEFLPRPQGAAPAIACGNRHPEISLPAAFAAFQSILSRTGRNVASTVQLSATREMTTEDVIEERDGEEPTAIGHTRVSIKHLFHTGLWAAIRSGFRDGYNAEADHFIISGHTEDEIRTALARSERAIADAAGYTKFTTDTSRMFDLRADERHPQPYSSAEVSARFAQLFDAAQQEWVYQQFAEPFSVEGFEYVFSQDEIRRLAVKFGPSIQLNERLYDKIRAAKQAAGFLPDFDFEPSVDEADTLTTAKELIFYMHWLRANGRPATLVPPNLGFKKRQAYPETLHPSAESPVGLYQYVEHKMWPELAPRVERDFGGDPIAELGARVKQLAAVARFFDATLSIHSGSGKQERVLRVIGWETQGRLNYKISGELQLQLLDVLSEQEAGSHWRTLYDRMAARTEGFAARGCFGEESDLAAQYRATGKGYYLGDPARGRVDGNLFHVFWIGNTNGSRDIHAPDGDARFFKQKLDELPDVLLHEVRRRNQAYLEWLSQCLWGS
ncbi:MAG: tagaturonate epimerase family protein, partial [Bryobacterales bacterium]|nr:tagaturonate epimerase family protein [Bryobacterales bacterium]